MRGEWSAYRGIYVSATPEENVSQSACIKRPWRSDILSYTVERPSAVQEQDGI